VAHVDVLYVAWNRREFTTATWAWMIAHTNWKLVNKLIVYDDGSSDGTLEFLREQTEKGKIPLRRSTRDVPIELRLSNTGSPPAIMNHYLTTAEAEFFAKIDSDIALPGSWLDRLLDVMHQHPELDLLGMEAGMVALDGRDGKNYERYDASPCSHIGGVGLMRVSAFKSRPEIPYRGRFGFGEWQDRYEPTRAWIEPDLLVPQLDRVPTEPWASLTEEYIENGWSRPWPKYDPDWMLPYFNWVNLEPEVTG